MKLFNKWKDRILTRKTPAIVVHDENTIEVVEGMIRESNHLKDPWADKGYEIQTKPITLIINGKPQSGFVCSSVGTTVKLHEDIIVSSAGRESDGIVIRWAGTIGKMTSADIIEKGMDLVGSMKRILIGIGIGMALYAIVVGPIISKILS